MKDVAKGGSVAALIVSGAFDRHLMAFFMTDDEKHISQQALTEVLPSESLKIIREALLGKFRKDPIAVIVEGELSNLHPRFDPRIIGKCKQQQQCKRVCKEEFTCAGVTGPCEPNSDCGSLHCGDHYCETNSCDYYHCIGFECEANECLLQSCDTFAKGKTLNVINFHDFDRHQDVRFIKELSEVLGTRTTNTLQNEIIQMIKKNETLQSRGFIR